jgi:ATP-binding cassette subfamily C (CFTR/MRP) protein 10
LITSFTETEKEMVAVERAHQFERIESENWEGIETKPENWPLQPSIKFINVSLQYNTDDDEGLHYN